MAIPVAVPKPAALTLTLALSQREREKKLQARTPEQLHAAPIWVTRRYFAP